MIWRPAGRLATGPLPPGDLAARFLAAVMRPPRDFLAMVFWEFGMVAERLTVRGIIGRPAGFGYGVQPDLDRGENNSLEWLAKKTLKTI